MSDLAFPTLVSENWKLTRTPQFNTKVQISASGARTACGFRSTPLWRWTLKNGVLQSADTIADLQAIEGFVNTLQGMWDSFLWTDPETLSSTTGEVRVALLADHHDFERLCHEIWQLGQISFQQVRA